FNKIHGLEAEILEQNTYLRHTLAGPSSNLKDSVTSIKRILLEQVAIDYPELLELKVSDKHSIKLREYLDIIERDAMKIVTTVASQLKVDTGIDEKKLGEIEIINFLESYTTEHNDRASLGFKVDFAYDKDVFVKNGERVKTFILAETDL